MNISLTASNGTYSIYLKRDFDTLDEIISLLVKPVLLAASFSEAQLDQYFVKEEEFNIVFKGWDDDEEVAANAAPQQPPMEKVVCKKEVFSKAPVEKKAVAKQATARMAGVYE